jgi:purine-binding chemotaxis protein CheW
MSEMRQHLVGPSDAMAERALLEKRASELAVKPVRALETGERLEIVEFTMAHERYGIESKFVQEVSPLRELTPLPGTPPFVMGIVNLRGRVISLVDLKKFFALPEKGLSDTNHVIMLSSPEMEFGILADALLGVRDVLAGELQGDIPTFTGHRKEYLVGVARDGTVVLDARKILGDPNIIVRDQGTD